MSQINGVVIGVVTNANDPEKNGRIKVRFPWLDDKHETDWIRIATMMAGSFRGSLFRPEVNDEVLVAFDHGDVRFPYVIGFLWNGQDQPPGGAEGGLMIEDAHGNTISMSNGKIVIKSVGVVEIKGATITINGRVVVPNTNPI
jgi:hypothetical protein